MDTDTIITVAVCFAMSSLGFFLLAATFHLLGC